MIHAVSQEIQPLRGHHNREEILFLCKLHELDTVGHPSHHRVGGTTGDVRGININTALRFPLSPHGDRPLQACRLEFCRDLRTDHGLVPDMRACRSSNHKHPLLERDEQVLHTLRRPCVNRVCRISFRDNTDLADDVHPIVNDLVAVTCGERDALVSPAEDPLNTDDRISPRPFIEDTPSAHHTANHPSVRCGTMVRDMVHLGEDKVRAVGVISPTAKDDVILAVTLSLSCRLD